MPNCIKCGAFTKYNGGTCSNCYNGNTKAVSNSGLSDKDYFSSENMIKGRIAETLIEEMFLKLKFKVSRFGMEHAIPGIKESLRGSTDEVSMKLRRMPDFVVQHPESKSFHFVEVKFRANGYFKFNDFGKDFPEGYDSAFLILVSKGYIKCLTVKELKEGKEITPESKNYLGYRPEFSAYKEKIVDYCDFALQFFACVE